ncbi:3-hydroxyacyl-thioester dehydratase HtdY [Acrocarpospora macrocephala]|uniref:3-hydroxyacyl-thioester dehydratase HtdY n=1 Tax=Acrocarpospora macrocephala TaxID=150177 RepID=A0A5M3WTA5_9ACTN|nr:MaoC family dehydratase [Acrocarpospora macrocephala]GES11289.1 3-hydroxyacyl-thioester dehydratase HtdY [Acrocarpospora macrocephala]
MTVDPTKVGTTLEGSPASWDSKDALLYALGVGAGAEDPLKDLKYTTENSEGVPQEVLPTFATVMTGGVRRHPTELIGSVPRSSILHGEQKVVLHRTIPTAGTVVSDGEITGIYDKGKHANLVTSSVLTDATSGERYAEVQSTLVLRGEGGFGGDPGPATRWEVPAREPDTIVSHPTRVDQALLYRLSGDRNPLHSDPAFAAKAGMPRPILHGLCTYGFAGRALLAAIADDDPARFGEFSVRFASTVNPGDVLDTWIWRTDDGAIFQTRVGDAVVLDRGVFRLR